jgi:hypothetical protein
MRKVNRGSNDVRNEPASSHGSGNKVLMAARVSKDFHERVQAECVRREVTLRKLLISALEAYFAADSDQGVPTRVITLGRIDDDVPQIRAYKGLWSTYLDKMPNEKIETMVHAMKWDLQMKKSARRKGPKKRIGRES